MKVILFSLVVFFASTASAQVAVRIPLQSYKSHDWINVQIVNSSTKPVSFCVEYGYRSYFDYDHFEATPTPVYIQQKSEKGWSTLLTGPDIGSSRQPETLAPGMSQSYPFRINARGSVRLVLDYWTGDAGDSCDSRKARQAKSRVITLE